MSKIAFAWELGANFGHLLRELPVAENLRDKGHDALFVVRDVGIAETLLTAGNFTFIASPQAPPPARHVRAPINYAQMLAQSGYSDRALLRALLHAWLNLWQLIKPDAVVIDHAPTALLAARVLGIPATLLGTGFTIPPQSDPLPSIRPWENISAAELRQVDDALLANINAALKHFGAEPISRIAEMFLNLPTRFTTFAELDIDGDSPPDQYVGPIGALRNHRNVQWRGRHPKRVLAYLRHGFPDVEPLLTALKQLDAEIICVMPGAPSSVATGIDAPHLHFYDEPINLLSLLPLASAVVCYAGAGLIAESLLAGAPLLLAPHFVEQYMSAKRVEALGAGIMIGQQRTTAIFKEALDRLISDMSYTSAAVAFKRKFAAFDPSAASEQVASAVLATIRE